MRLGALISVLMLGSACSATISGQATPRATPVDIATLNTGAIVTEPTDYELRFASFHAQRIRLIEGRRLLNILVHPIDFLPSVTKSSYTKIFADVDEMTGTGGLSPEFKDVVSANDLVVGVSATRTNGSIRNLESMFVGILEFGTVANAEAAAAAMYSIGVTRSDPRQPVMIPNYPGAHGSATNSNVNAFQSHGRFVIITAIQEEPRIDQNATTEKIKAALDKQIAALDTFQAIASDDLLDLPVDQDGMVRRTMDKSPAGDPYGMGFHNEDFGIFLPSGILHYERNALDTRKAFDKAGVDLIGRRYSTVYRTRDVEAAFALQTALARRGKDDTALDPPPGIADAQCVRLAEPDKNRNYNGFCVLVYDRYVAVVMSLTSQLSSTQLADPILQQRAAAQYVILTKSE
ncbi:DUF7373 family lipoprotein [Nocardia caishijiensis]|uniref:DUF7373 family lipoprotein n=1 Tax=Nocardia caishijiensis TaxID=184756 RepID=UPI0012EDB43A|nr:hypothetical protein [Nocardia caishijiensis]